MGTVYDLVDAALRGDIQQVQFLIGNGADVNAQDGEYGNALQAASYKGSFETVKLLIDNGADVNAQGGTFGNSLQAASYTGRLEIVKLLLDNNADVNAQGGAFGNALQAASYEGSFEIVKLLIDNKADVNAQGGEYGYALQAASYEGSLEIVELLLDNKADVNAQGGAFGNALQAASYEGSFEIVRLLIDNKADVNAQGGEYGYALQAASVSYTGRLEIVKLLIDNKADVNAQGGEYGNALQAASYKGSFEIVKLLIDNEADVNAQGGAFGNALQAASYTGRLEIVKLLIDNGADVNAQGGEYSYALHAAVIALHHHITSVLLEHGARADSKDSFNRNALHYAVRASSFHISQLLLAHGASPEDLDDAKMSPFDICIQNRKFNLIHLLLSWKTQTPRLSASEWHDCLNWASDSHIAFRTSIPQSIQNYGNGLRQFLMNESFPITSSRVIPWKRHSLIGSMAEKIVYILASGDMLQHISPSTFHCRWWRKCRQEKSDDLSPRRRGEIRESSWDWSVQSYTIPDNETCRRLEPGEYFAEIGFRVSCYEITHQSWPDLQRDVQSDEEDRATFRDEGFLCIAAPNPLPDHHDTTSRSILRPVYLLTTVNDSPIMLAENSEDLLKPLIWKFKSVIAKNCAVASRQLSVSRSQVLDHSGGNPRLLTRLLNDAQVLEGIAQNHKSLVQDLTLLVRVNNEMKEFDQLSDKIRELEKKSQGIIQLEFNLTSILEAQRSTTTNRSLKRLSWITFVFLPLLFISSLFGMNVDVLANNPSWWLYFPLSAGCMFSTLTVLACFKRFNTLEGRLERHFSWLTGGEKALDEERGSISLARRRELTMQYSLYGKKRR